MDWNVRNAPAKPLHGFLHSRQMRGPGAAGLELNSEAATSYVSKTRLS